jgi:hypothetical protein
MQKYGPRLRSALLTAAILTTSLLGSGSVSVAASASPPSVSGLRQATTTRAPVAQKPLKVALQVGHWKNNELPQELNSLVGRTGAAAGGRTELQLNLEVANRVAPILRAAGISVDILPATVPTGYNADAFIALHADGNTSSSARGFKISTRWRSEVAFQDARLVEILTENYGAATGLPEDRDNITRNMRGYYAYASWRPNWRISNYTPAAIVEMGFITNATDRNFMFSETNRLVVGITGGILRFLAYAYPAGRSQSYGLGIVDGDINMAAPTFPRRGGGGGSASQGTPGDWQALIMGPLQVPVFDRPGSGTVLTTLPRGRFHHSTLRQGDYYRITLPTGQEGWLHRNVVVIQM